jgi:putative hydrolase of the HAD superfamily
VDREMIKNVIFDYGNTVIQYKPCFMADKYIEDDSDREFIYEVLFDRLYWDALDDGSITDEEIILDCKKRLPERLHKVIEKIYYNWVYNLPEIPGMYRLISDVRSKYGMRVFLLSNISSYFAEHAHELPEMNLFEKCFFSAEMGCIKPSRKIFERVLSECGILADETLFVDDSEKNIKGAEAVGIHGYLFDGDAVKLEKYIEEILKKDD